MIWGFEESKKGKSLKTKPGWNGRMEFEHCSNGWFVMEHPTKMDNEMAPFHCRKPPYTKLYIYIAWYVIYGTGRHIVSYSTTIASDVYIYIYCI